MQTTNGTTPSVVRQYSYGNDLISQRQLINNNWTTSFFEYDGHGSVRFLTDAAGNVTDSYDYDAFGNLINQVGTTPNLYLYAGEQFDPDLGFYYNRARYLNVGTGRFFTIDSFEGNTEDPLSLHKYVYAKNNPANIVDPSGQFGIAQEASNIDLSGILNVASQGSLYISKLSSSLFTPIKLHCQIDIITAMIRIFQSTSNGQVGKEASFRVDGNMLAYNIVISPFTNQQQTQRFSIMKGFGGTFAIFHVHPAVSGEYPSTPENNHENNGRGDTGLADDYNLMIYVVSAKGLTVYDAKTKQTAELRKGLDWVKPCKDPVKGD